ncbi:MAG: flagellar motor protein MotB [Gemmatimonadetes bacterium]|nr:flagellar motor protein MotB [Gemmatimonadota bacterium]
MLATLDRFLVDTAVEDETHGNLLLTAGLQLSFRASDKDTDGDGVVDKNDECAGTPLGAIVDSRGCPSDTDGDGVYDGLDRCPGSPPRAKIDARGCPTDSDGDGVYDGLDRCNNTPAGVPVDARGCTKDTDGDGVHDGIDRCPRTKRGVEIDSKGCEVTEVEREMLDTGMIRLDSIFFESGKAILKPESFPSLDEVGKVLEKWPALRIEIGGYTDSQGGAAFNEKLSRSRADAVRDYLTKSFAGIDAKQLKAAGYGEAKPIADNGTKEGRARNRRVEFKVLNRGVLTQ